MRPTTHVPVRPPPVLLIVWALVLSACCALVFAQGCSKQAVRTQQLTANSVARAFNRVEPLWVAEAEREATAAARAVCPSDASPCDRAAAHIAADRTFDRWEPLVTAWDTAVALHDAWQDELARCRERGDGGCTLGTDLGGRFLRAVEVWRCAVRTLGHPEYDPLPGAPTCASGGP